MRALYRTISLRQVEQHPTRTLLMVLTVALGVAAWVTTRILDQTLSGALRSAATPSAGLADLHVSNGDLGIPRSFAARLASIPGVRYGALFDAESADLFSVVRPASATATVDADRSRILQAPWTTEQGLCVLTRLELRRHILGMVDRLFAVAYLQEVAVAVVATLGVATALWISLRQRTRELGLLRVLGATQGQARLVVFAEASLLTLLGLVFGLAGGVALQWYVLRVILLEESGFVFPVQLPWLHAVLASLLMLLSGGVAVIGPLLTASRLRIPEAIAFE
jgi:putative ABC transport system permease protein